MNIKDTQHIIAELNKKENYTTTQEIQDADLIMINTCSVREKPVSKLFSQLGQYKNNKKENAKIGVCGCTASHLGKEIIKRAPYVDFVIGARNVSKISEAVNKKGSVIVDLKYDDTTYEFAQQKNTKHKISVNISLGCDKQCAFCIVPSTRGKEISIPPELILKEIQKSVDNGAKEVLLLGQNVNNYGKSFTHSREKTNFTQLLKKISQIENLERIRFTSPHPLHMDDIFLEEFAKNDKICKSIHVPLQSGSTKILKAMRRGYTKEWFLNRCKKIKELVPDVRLSTDIIVGFPGEDNLDFEDTIDVINEIKFDQIFNFKYSPRPNTEALKMENTVDDEVAAKRLTKIIELHKNHQSEHMKNNVGKILNVLFESFKPNGEIMGFSDNNCCVLVKGDESLIGKTKNVVIKSHKRTYLYGEVL